MKWVIIILAFVGVISILGGLSGRVRNYSESESGEPSLVRSQPVVRAAIILFGAVCALGAFGCFHKKVYGWYIVAGLLIVHIVGTLFVAIRIAMFSPSYYLNASWMIIQVVALIYFFRWWKGKREEFKSA